MFKMVGIKCMEETCSRRYIHGSYSILKGQSVRADFYIQQSKGARESNMRIQLRNLWSINTQRDSKHSSSCIGRSSDNIHYSPFQLGM